MASRVKVVQARLGHASASETLDTYSHLWPDSDDRTRTAVDAVLSADYVRTKGGGRWTQPLVRNRLADESVGKPDSVPAACDRRRSSICDRCCQRPGAIYPETRASSPQASPQALARPRDLAPGGVYRATPVTWGAGGLLHRRFTLTGLRTARRSVFCGTVPRVTPGGRYPPPCSVESGLSSATLPGGRDRLTDSSDSDVTARSSKDARPRPSTAGSSRASVGL